MQKDAGFLGGLFDLSFTEFVTIRIIKVLYVIAIILSGVAALAFFVASATRGAVAAVGGLVISPILFLLWVLASRVWLELVVVAFRIAENTNILVEQGKGDSASHSEPDSPA